MSIQQRVCALVLMALMTSGCVTQFGYVPAYARNESGRAPAYADVRNFAVQVRNGYDTRETLNRYAGYYGAGVAVAAAAAIMALSIYDSGSAALVGIPVGTGFLGGLAAVFQNEEKALVYGRASRYLSDLIILSDERLEQRVRAAAHPVTARDDAQDAVREAREELSDARFRLSTVQKQAGEALSRIASMKPDDPNRTEAQERASASQRAVAEAEANVVMAMEAVERAQRRAARAEQRVSEPRHANPREEAEKAEALCLQRDVTAVLARVADVLTPLTPRAAQALQAVQAPGGAKLPTPETKTSDRVPILGSGDFALPASSVCQDDVARPAVPRVAPRPAPPGAPA